MNTVSVHAADRLTSLTSHTGYPALRAYTYDANANRTSETLGAMITSITHVAGTNRIHKVGTQAMAFDAAGNLTSYAGKTFTHGADGRLRSTTTSAGTVTYQYDGLGRRVSKSGPATLVPGGFVRYVYDSAHHLIGEYKADGTPIKEYVWIDDLPVAMIRFQGPWSLEGFAIETDHLGTPRLLTDATRAPRWRWTSPPFGEVLPDENPSGFGAITFNLRFPGQYYDKETGLHYNWNRYYDPERGRYDQSDPIGLAGGWNTYGYVGANPVSYSDPTGEVAVPVVIGGTIAVGACIATNCTQPFGQAMQSVANSLSNGIDAIREWCSEDEGDEECERLAKQAKGLAKRVEEHITNEHFHSKPCVNLNQTLSAAKLLGCDMRSPNFANAISVFNRVCTDPNNFPPPYSKPQGPPYQRY